MSFRIQTLDWLNERVSALELELRESQAETAAALKFLECELGWEYFRAEFLCHDDEKQATNSMQNAQALKNYLSETGHGIRLLKELSVLKSRK